MAGVGAVPGDTIHAVLLNVTVTEPLSAGELCVWGTGNEKPDVAMVSYVQGQTVPNLVVAPLGADGTVTVQTTGGATHVIADVVGYFSPSCGVARMVSIDAARVLDTRRVGRSLGGASWLEVPLAGRPASPPPASPPWC